ncbi:protein phosphatase 2C domain-containing protein [uncultured Microscilla sp.]|uniref:PP2C family protein-serine/threonine phosphatase n=1 Tax=uncultured Microscilla sp. TaxID=432653 RepID=UPI00262932B3|nr:protein phosphatase 2C domain-containing protein [uncultured Microscilla sp.]
MNIPLFQTFSTSLAKADKAKNGDACHCKILKETTQTLAVMALADGVGSKPCDYKASTTAVDAFLAHFGDNPDQTDIKARMRAAAQHANQRVHQTSANCRGMMTTFVATVWQVGASLLYFTSVGDSRLYLQHEGTLVQLTQDDSVEKTETVGGQTYNRSYITEALGAGVVHFDIQTQPFLPGDACWLMSDGFYSVVPASALIQLWRYTNFAHGTEQVFKQYIPQYQDDASVVALRRNDAPNSFATVFDQWKIECSTQTLPANMQISALTCTIFEATHHSLLKAATKEALRWLQVLDDLTIIPNLVTIERLLQAFGKAKLNDQEVYKNIRKLLAKASQK